LIGHTPFSDKEGIKYAFYKIKTFSGIPGFRITRAGTFTLRLFDPQRLTGGPLSTSIGHVGRGD
jgi:hypothetical protein